MMAVASLMLDYNLEGKKQTFFDSRTAVCRISRNVARHPPSCSPSLR